MTDDRGIYERLVLEGFQSGLSWLTILRKREGFRAAFAGFEIEAVARFGKRDVRPPAGGRRRSCATGARSRRRSPTRRRRPRSTWALAELVWSHAPSGRRRGAARGSADLPAITAGVDGAVEGAQAARLPLRRPDDRLRGDAGLRDRQRPPRRLLGARRGRARATRHYPGAGMDERALAERLITYDTSTLEGMQSAAGFVKGWLEARDVEVTGTMHNGRPVLAATVGPANGPTIVLHGHLDVVPARPEQFSPRVDGDRLFGRGAYDMKGGLAGDDAARVHDLAAQERRARALRLRGRRGVRGGRAARLGLPRRAGLHGRLRDHRRADRHAHRHPGQGRAGDAHRGDRHRRPRLDALGRATTRCSRRSTCSARSRRCPSRASRPTCSTGPRSTSAGSSAATRSTRSPTCARSTSTSATCRGRTPRRSGPRSTRCPTRAS